MATEPGWLVTYLDRFLPIKTHDPLITCSCKFTYQTKTIIFPLKDIFSLGRIMTYLERLLTIKSFNLLITWSCMVT